MRYDSLHRSLLWSVKNIILAVSEGCLTLLLRRVIFRWQVETGLTASVWIGEVSLQESLLLILVIFDLSSDLLRVQRWKECRSRGLIRLATRCNRGGDCELWWILSGCYNAWLRASKLLLLIILRWVLWILLLRVRAKESEKIFYTLPTLYIGFIDEVLEVILLIQTQPHLFLVCYSLVA